MNLANFWVVCVAANYLLTDVQASETTTSLRTTTAPQEPTQPTTGTSEPGLNSDVVLSVAASMIAAIFMLGFLGVMLRIVCKHPEVFGDRCRLTSAEGFFAALRLRPVDENPERLQHEALAPDAIIVDYRSRGGNNEGLPVARLDNHAEGPSCRIL